MFTNPSLLNLIFFHSNIHPHNHNPSLPICFFFSLSLSPEQNSHMTELAFSHNSSGFFLQFRKLVACLLGGKEWKINKWKKRHQRLSLNGFDSLAKTGRQTKMRKMQLLNLQNRRLKDVRTKKIQTRKFPFFVGIIKRPWLTFGTSKHSLKDGEFL